MAEKIIVTQAKFVASAVGKEQYPAGDLAEIAFVGRSNVGKSSLINSLTRVNNLARVSGQPGKTQTINFFDVGIRTGESGRKNFWLVDLPGYGYAKAAKSARKTWAKFIEEYLTSSREIKFVAQLIDIRHEPTDSDVKMFEWLTGHGLDVLTIATKADKIGRGAREKQLGVIRKTLGIPATSVLAYSSQKNEGRSDLLDVIASVLI